MTPSDKCRVGECDRWAAASMVREGLPGPLRLCATHTEQFRQNGAEWTIDWAANGDEPSSVIAPQSVQPLFSSPETPAAAPDASEPHGLGRVFKSLLHRTARAGDPAGDRPAPKGRARK